MLQKNSATQKITSLKIEDLCSQEDLSNNLWYELSESDQALVMGGATVLAKWGNWQYTAEMGWVCQPGKVC